MQDEVTAVTQLLQTGSASDGEVPYKPSSVCALSCYYWLVLFQSV